eukprot:TRINITY_DN2399_c0_g1_i2.p1 TRINITY_DN2399_c0_g1~~TRINITY_DN2399_c0_g1_i2.p1  ORF type:complete len:381 (+),score=54.47 TRINITY_DN2399_c0_g1_i2:902-2044(+)
MIFCFSFFVVLGIVAAPYKGVANVLYDRWKKPVRAPSFFVLDRGSGKLVPETIAPLVAMAMRTVYGNRVLKRVTRTNRVGLRVMRKLSVNQGIKFDDPASKSDILPFIKYYGIDTSEMLEDPASFTCFNEFFYRKLRIGARPLAPGGSRSAVSPADCRMMVFAELEQATRLWVKGREFSITSLIQDADLAKTYEGGSAVLARLAPQDYHRFHFAVDGQFMWSRPIDGRYHTVNPIAVNAPNLNVFGENKRVVCCIKSREFGQVLSIAVGALLVGSIYITAEDKSWVERGDEHGYFAFGGSTIILLFEQGAITFCPDLVNNSLRPVETLIRMGEHIGTSTKPPALSESDDETDRLKSGSDQEESTGSVRFKTPKAKDKKAK